MSTVPVLMYHHVNPNRGDMVTVTPEVFDAQMRHIREAGYRTLSLDDLIGFMEGRIELKEKSVAVTFDDGYLDNYIFAYPILKFHRIKASIFIVSRWAEAAAEAQGSYHKKDLLVDFRKNPPTHDDSKMLIEKGLFHRACMDWETIGEMRDSGLVDFYSHTMTHKSCDVLSREELLKEIKGSKDVLEERLKAPCKYLCWPKGRYSDDAVRIAREAGYSGIFTTRQGTVKKGSDPFSIKRVVVKDKTRWFRTRLTIYTNPVLSELYLKVKGKGGA